MKTLFPYPVLFGDVTVRVADIEIDDEPIHDRVNDDNREVDLSGIERRQWKTARINFSLDAPASELEERTDVAVTAILNCGLSNTRVAVPLSPDLTSPGRWIGSLDLERDAWYGRATLRAEITASVEEVASRIIGAADEWLVSFDDLPRSPVTGALTIRWVDFASPDDDVRFLRHYATDPWYLRIDPDDPVLFLNRSFEGLEALLADRRRRPAAEQALHNHARASLAAEIWMTLFNAALDATELDEDEQLVWPPEDWQTAVLTSLLNRMYEDKGRDDALREAYEARHSAEAAATLQERLLPAASSQVRLPRLLREGIRSLGNEPAEVQEDEE